MINEKIATIVPIKHLDLIKDDSYFMALSYIRTEEYMSFFIERAKEEKYVILDNSTIELGEPEPFFTYLAQAMTMDVSCIVLPDYFQDSARTLAAMKEAMAEVDRFRFHGDVMGIPQGTNRHEWSECAREMLGYTDVIGVSYRYNNMFGDRATAVEILRTLASHTGVSVHLLGCYGNPMWEVSHVLSYKCVQGVDSSYPCHMTKLGVEISSTSRRSPDIHTDIVNDEYDLDLLRQNINKWKLMCAGVVG